MPHPRLSIRHWVALGATRTVFILILLGALACGFAIEVRPQPAWGTLCSAWEHPSWSIPLAVPGGFFRTCVTLGPYTRVRWLRLG